MKGTPAIFDTMMYQLKCSQLQNLYSSKTLCAIDHVLATISTKAVRGYKFVVLSQLLI